MPKSKTTTKTKVESKSETSIEEKVLTKTELKKVERIRKDLITLRKQVDTAYLDMAEKLHEVHSKQYYSKQWGYDSFEEYCERELVFEWRKAKWLVDIWQKATDLSLDRDSLSKLPWTKLRSILRAMTNKTTAKKWMKQAEKLSVRELVDAVKKELGEGGGATPGKTTMKFTLESHEVNIVSEAIAEAKSIDESYTDTTALVTVCQDWMENQGKTPTRTSLQQRIEFLEKYYDVKISFKKTGNAKGKVEEKVEEKAEEKKVPAKGKKAAEKPAAKKGKEVAAKPPAKKGKGKAASKEKEPNLDDLLGEGEDVNTDADGDADGDGQSIDDLIGI